MLFIVLVKPISAILPIRTKSEQKEKKLLEQEMDTLRPNWFTPKSNHYRQ